MLILTSPDPEFRIPRNLKEVDDDWIVSLVCLVNNVQDQRDGMKVHSIRLEDRLLKIMKIFYHILYLFISK
jgi:hypothetical protein